MSVISTFMAINQEKKSRMLMLIAIIVLQNITLLLFMYEYDKSGSIQWKKKEKSLREEIKKQYATISN